MGRAITTTSVHLFWSNPFSKEAVHIVNIMNEITRLLINFKCPKGFLHLHVKSEYGVLKLVCWGSFNSIMPFDECALLLATSAFCKMPQSENIQQYYSCVFLD